MKQWNTGTKREPQQQETGLRRVEALLQASADWEPGAPAPVGLEWDALLRTRKRKTGFAAWTEALLKARPAFVGIGASAALAAGALLWVMSGSNNSNTQATNPAPVPDAAIQVALTEVGEKINAPLVAQAADSAPEASAAPAKRPAKNKEAKAAVKSSASADRGSSAASAAAQTGVTRPRRKRGSSNSGARKMVPGERRLSVPIPLPRRPASLLAQDATGKARQHPERQQSTGKAAPPAAVWKTETVQQYAYGTGTPVLVEQPSEDGSGIIMIPAVALSDTGEFAPYDPTIDSE